MFYFNLFIMKSSLVSIQKNNIFEIYFFIFDNIIDKPFNYVTTKFKHFKIQYSQQKIILNALFYLNKWD